jgi:hypothetical protein
MGEASVNQYLTMLQLENFTPLTMGTNAVNQYITDVREVLAQIQAHASPQKFHSLILRISVRLEHLEHNNNFTSNTHFQHCKDDLARIREQLAVKPFRALHHCTRVS